MRCLACAGLLVMAIAATQGCSGSEVTQSDTAAVRSEFSQDKYEAAMKKAGKGAELEREKEAAARRGEPQ